MTRLRGGIRTILLALALLSNALANERNLPSFSLDREDTRIRVQQTATDEEGGIFVSRTGGCRGEDITLTTVYAPAPKQAETRYGETLITSNAVLREQPRGDQEQATLDFFDGTLELSDELCPENIQHSDDPQVSLIQGRTTILGSSAFLDNATGLGEMEGPIQLHRRAEGDSPSLDATSDRLEFDVDKDITILKGNVQVESDGRVSEADTLEFDEQSSLAILRGNPARSREGSDVVEGKVIEYDLDSNDVVVIGGVSATFDSNEGNNSGE